MDSTVMCPQCQTRNAATNNHCQTCGVLLKPTLIGENQTCPFCGKPVVPTDYFCPACGRKIREKPLSTTPMTQLGIYALSFFLPPFGLWPGFKYLRQKNGTHKVMGGIAVLLTFASVIVAGYYIITIANQVNEEVSKQLQNMTF